LLYEDENDNYNYEKGAYATIAMHWGDANKRLTIGARKRGFPGILKNRSFQVVVVRENNGTGVEATTHPDKLVQYSGEQITVPVL
jgi:alpha-D-xyloside xylohydrolase